MTMHVAQMNIGQLWHPLDDPHVAGFTDNPDRVNAIAERPAWVLRNEDGAGQAAVSARHDGDAWALCTQQRAERFRPQDDRTYVIRPVPAGRRPAGGLDRFDPLRDEGPTDAAYEFRYLRVRAQPEAWA